MSSKTQIIFIIVLIFNHLTALGQSDFPLEKQKRDAELWAAFNATYEFEKGSFLFGKWQGQHSTFPSEETLFYRWAIQGGYFHRLTKHWQLGAALQYTDQSNTSILSPQVFVRHTSQLWNIQFLKQAGIQWDTFSNPVMKDVANLKLGLSIFKELQLAQKPFYPIVSYRLFKLLDKKDDHENQRNIDQTRLRLDLVYSISPKVQLNLFGARETAYFFALAQFKEDANGQLVMSKPERRLNLITPVYGLGVYISLGHENRKFQLINF